MIGIFSRTVPLKHEEILPGEILSITVIWKVSCGRWGCWNQRGVFSGSHPAQGVLLRLVNSYLVRVELCEFCAWDMATKLFPALFYPSTLQWKLNFFSTHNKIATWTETEAAALFSCGSRGMPELVFPKSMNSSLVSIQKHSPSGLLLWQTQQNPRLTSVNFLATHSKSKQNRLANPFIVEYLSPAESQSTQGFQQTHLKTFLQEPNPGASGLQL